MKPFFWSHMPHQYYPDLVPFAKLLKKVAHILSPTVILLKPLRMRLLPKPPPPGSSLLLNSMVSSQSLFFSPLPYGTLPPLFHTPFWAQHSESHDLLVFWLPHWALILSLLCGFFLFTSISCDRSSLGSCPPGSPFLSPLSISPIWVLNINF